MTQPNEYTEALETSPTQPPIFDGEIIDWYCENEKTIRRALKIAARLSQEPSDEMQLAAMGLDHPEFYDPAKHFRAMVNQMLKEIDNG